MSASLVEQTQQETAKRQNEMLSKLPPDYAKTKKIHSDLLEKGIIRKREFQLRSISDPPIDVKEPLYNTRVK